MPTPVLPDTMQASSHGMARPSSISVLVRSTSEEGRSTLLMAGRISRSAFMARSALETVWASTPWVESTTSTAPLACCQGARHLVGEVDVAGGVDEVELVGLPVIGLVHHAHGLALDGDATLALDVHGVEQLGLHVALGHGVRLLEDAIRDRRLTVVDVGDDGEVPDM